MTSRAEPAIEVVGLTKSYTDVAAVRGVDLSISRGEIFALLGPNGAGKTTTVEILEGYRGRDGGEVRVLGLDPAHQRAALKRRIGIVLQSTGVERYLTVAETLASYGELYPHPRSVDEVVELVGLGGKRDERVVRLSGGQQRRLDMAVALIGDPELLFLDEPTTGFDPSARREAWQVVKDLVALGKSVLLTTHYMDEAQFLADRVGVIVGGRIVDEGPPATLGDRYRTRSTIRFRLRAGAAPFDGTTPGADGFSELTVEDTPAALRRLLDWAEVSGERLEDLEVRRPSLEDVYLLLTGESSGPVATPARP